MRRHNISIVVIKDRVGANPLVALDDAKSLELLSSIRCNVNLLTIPEELLRSNLKLEFTLWPRILDKLVDASDEFSL